ncbi:JAB domain-containing protein [Bacillus toyonensis]|uniref:DNA repair protein n=1 Tax=Bacillus toyonensis TaxID=155322 RepID=A0A2B5CCV5_9BACI|nr:JAB domain-containing protein [Bacillus toyonensis]PEJ91293.1 DNA repair protein [Bacillus toyonensis]PEK76010.1 DNA repair protein [Bacillus toyonensis]PEL17560.1 DNA repair protein [Bacillus toyonensis]PFY44078.1 DNA repair protein [Bacillus toyonensis]PFY49341.1 DNA repair protein [Bacillus toyonensis]
MGKKIMVQSVKLGKESNRIYDLETKRINSPEDAAHFKKIIFDIESIPHEVFGVFNLNTKNDIIGCSIVFQGTVDASLVNPRETFQTAILNNASSIICFHNHLSGHSIESREDIEATRRLKECGDIIGIRLLDHIIIGDSNFASLRRKGII